MGTRSVMAALSFSLLMAGGAAYCYTRNQALQSEGRWLMERGSAQAQDYAQRFDGAAADAQLKTFSERRAVLERAHRWQRGMMVSILAAALAAVSAYVLFLLKRLDDQMVDATGESRHRPPAPPERAPALASSSR